MIISAKKIKKRNFDWVFAVSLTGLIFFAGFLGFSQYKQFLNKKAIFLEKEKISEQTDAMEKKNSQLFNSIKYFNSIDYKDRLAKGQMGFKQDGEEVYFFAENNQPENAVSAEKNSQSNFTKWRKYFYP